MPNQIHHKGSCAVLSPSEPWSETLEGGLADTAARLDPESRERCQTPGEELANSISHGLGLIAALGGIPFLLRHAALERGPAGTLGASVFAATVIFLYVSSMLYHALPRGRAKRWMQIVEHIAIYLLIAGTYTPFALGILAGPAGWALLGTIWSLALAGTVFKAVIGTKRSGISTLLYLAMGWMGVVMAWPLWQQMPHNGFLWILFGGLAYSGGVTFFAVGHKLRYSHLIWHLFVLAGTALHAIAIFRYAF